MVYAIYAATFLFCYFYLKILKGNIFHTHSLSNILAILEEKLMIRQLKSIS